MLCASDDFAPFAPHVPGRVVAVDCDADTGFAWPSPETCGPGEPTDGYPTVTGAELVGRFMAWRAAPSPRPRLVAERLRVAGKVDLARFFVGLTLSPEDPNPRVERLVVDSAGANNAVNCKPPKSFWQDQRRQVEFDRCEVGWSRVGARPAGMVVGGGMLWERFVISSGDDMFQLWGTADRDVGNTTIRNGWAGRPYRVAGAHNDIIQFRQHAGALIEDCTFELWPAADSPVRLPLENRVVMVNTDLGAVGDVTVRHCLLGGGAYTVGGAPVGANVHRLVFDDLVHLYPGRYGYAPYEFGPTVHVAGNPEVTYSGRWADTGLPVAGKR